MTQFTNYARSNENIFAKYFLELDPETSLIERIWSIDQMIYRVNHIIKTYYTLDDYTLSKFILDFNPETLKPEPIKLIVYQRSNFTEDNSRISKLEYILKDKFSNPFNESNSQLKLFLLKSELLEFTFWLSLSVPTQFFNAPFRWFIKISLKNNAGIYEGHVETTRHIESQIILYKLGWISLATLFVSIISLIFEIKAIISNFKIYNRTQLAFKSIPKSVLVESYKKINLPGLIPIYNWEDIPFGVRLDFFGNWHGLEILGEIFIIAASLNGFIYDDGIPLSDISRIFLGIGFLIVSVGFSRYLEHWKKFYVLIITIQGSFYRNLRFVISVFPLYMGFCICGFLMFSPYIDNFSSLDKSAISLFALLNGDDIHATFGRIQAYYPYPIVGEAYLFIFIIMFITLVLNIFLFIIEDAYHAAKDFINTKAERHSRLHRRKAEISQSKPLLGDIDFDLPILFDIIEQSFDYIPFEKKKMFKPRKDRTYSKLDLDNPSINYQSLPLFNSDISTESSFHDLSIIPKTKDVLKSDEIQNAIFNKIKSSKLEFLNEVDQSMKNLKDKYSQKLDRDLEQLFSLFNKTEK